MTREGQAESVAEELRLAAEELRAAEALLKLALARVAMTRIYFAAFHAVRARLYADNLEPTSHGGVQRLFNLHFVKPGRYPAEASRLMARLQKYREEADYTESFVVDDDGARDELQAAQSFIDSIRKDLAQQGWPDGSAP